ncbi:PA2928 family protein [Streptomyces sp. DSM 44915]|uniref:PA2928 family protein n=1 Tax=Streptomyces chisholmiae TaxID=3075540 RepID=A0ABU2JNH7_9ACTN|nr:PA2928 family protein [Streptomyces sp. DSM 44915]MDT0266534.1 PA2928 family protein [Streptomyces sp. DSM 44915]
MNDPRNPGVAGGVRLITSPYGTPDRPSYPRRRNRSGGGLALFLGLAVPLGVGGAIFGTVLLSYPEGDVALQTGTGLAVTPAGEVALVPYERDGGTGVFRMFDDPWETRLAAVDVATGDSLWDVRLSGELIWEARVLATSDTHVYLNTDDGLRIVALADGSTVVAPDAIPGIGAGHIAAGSAYAFDSARNAVVAMDTLGEIYLIRIGELAATPADEATANAWRGRLSDGPLTSDDAELTGESAAAGEAGSLSLRATEIGARSSDLVLTDRAGGSRQLGGQPFREPEILLGGGVRVASAAPVVVGGGEPADPAEDVARRIEELLGADVPVEVSEELRRQLSDALGAGAELPGLPGWAGLAELTNLPELAELSDLPGLAGLPGLGGAAPRSEGDEQAGLLALGADQGYVVVQEAADAVGDNYRLHVVSLDSGEILATRLMAAEAGPAFTTPSGTSVLPVASADEEFAEHDELLLIRPDGSLVEVEVGATDFFGNPE